MPNQHKHIAILGGEANTFNRVGSNVYAFEILKSLEQISRTHSNWHFTILLNTVPVSDLPKPRKNWRYQVFGPSKLWTQWALPSYLFLNKNRFHGLFSPGHYTPAISPVPMIATIMDLAFLEFPKQFKFLDYWQLKIWTKQSVNKSSALIAISNFTRNKIIEHYKISPKKVSTVYPALPSSFTQHKTNLKTSIPLNFSNQTITKPYILYLGTIQPRKNIIAIIKALEILARNTTHNFNFVIAGKLGWLAEDTLKAINSSPIKEKIKMLGFVTDQEKIALLQNAKLTLVLGQHEGFGFPILESFFYSGTVLALNEGSLPETGGKGCLYVDNLSPELIMSQINRALQLTPKEKAKLAKNGRDQLNKFKWKDAGTQILEVMKTVF